MTNQAQILSEMIGKPIKAHKEGRRCRKCKHLMSMYNPNLYCFECMKKRVLDKRDKVK